MSEDPNEPTMNALMHDVAKYLTRVARNLPKDGPIPDVLSAMLVKDLYETHRGRPASARFDELSGAIADDGIRRTLRARLSEIDAMETDVRGGDAAAARRAAELALAFERDLRAVYDASMPS